MKISYNWLKSYIKLEEQPQKLAEILTAIGLEVEGLEVEEQIPGGLAGVVTGEVLSCSPHPNADKLTVTEVSVGGDAPLHIVCGAPNVAVGQKVLVATVGTELTFSSGEKVVIKRAKIRGEESFGMICAEDELGVGTSHEGIMVLPSDTPVGMAAKDYLQLEEDVVFEIGLTPNRIDAASHIGVARDLAAWSSAHGGVQSSVDYGAQSSVDCGIHHSVHGGIQGCIDGDVQCGAQDSAQCSVHSDAQGSVGGGVHGGVHGGVQCSVHGGAQCSVPVCRIPSVESFSSGRGTGVSIEVEAPDGAPRYAGLTLEGISVAPSPEWLQRRLRAIGLRPINNVVDITNFVLHETGHPLHAFDCAHITGNVVKVRYAAEGEKFITLDGIERVLSSQDLMICNADSPMCMAGIFGGQQSGVTEQTTSIFLESAFFNPVTIRKSSKRHGLKTDASFRFERGADPDMVPYALKRAALLLQEVAGAKVVNAPIDCYPNPIEPPVVTLGWEPLYTLMGIRLDKSLVKNILQGLECNILMESDASITVRVPLYRVDVTRPCDLAEEILRLWGYNSVEIPERVSASFHPAPKPDPEQIKTKMENLLVANGFNEIMCNSLCPAHWYESCSTYPPEQLVRLLNPLSSDLNVMRQTLILGGLEVIAYNMNRQQYNLRLFESGNVYAQHAQNAQNTPSALGVQHTLDSQNALNAFRESPRVAVWMTGLADEQQWRHPARPSHFFYLKGYIEKLFAQYGLSPVERGDVPDDLFSEGLKYTLNEKILATVGVIQKKVLARFGIKQDVYAAEICWDVLFKALKGKKITYAELPRYPEVRRDLALILDETVGYDQLHQIAFRTERRLIKRISLFDLYRGDKLPAGKKQYALGFILQDIDKTLTDRDVDSVMLRLLNAFEKEAGAILRN